MSYVILNVRNKHYVSREAHSNTFLKQSDFRCHHHYRNTQNIYIRKWWCTYGNESENERFHIFLSVTPCSHLGQVHAKPRALRQCACARMIYRVFHNSPIQNVIRRCWTRDWLMTDRLGVARNRSADYVCNLRTVRWLIEYRFLFYILAKLLVKECSLVIECILY